MLVSRVLETPEQTLLKTGLDESGEEIFAGSGSPLVPRVCEAQGMVLASGKKSLRWGRLATWVRGCGRRG